MSICLEPSSLTDCERRRLVREDTNTPMTSLNELKASAAEVGESLHTTTVALWESGNEKTTAEESFY